MPSYIQKLVKDSLKDNTEAVSIMTKADDLINDLCNSSLSEEDDEYLRQTIAHMIKSNR